MKMQRVVFLFCKNCSHDLSFSAVFHKYFGKINYAMAKFVKEYWIFGVVVILLISGGYYFLFSNKPKTFQTENIKPTPTEVISIPEITPEISPTPTQIPEVNKVINTTTIVPNGPAQGQIVCNYQIPVGPNTYGTAAINTTWNNLTIGKNGSAQAAVCVRVNGQGQTLMSLDNSANGSREDSAPWLAPNGSYNFILYDDRGGDAANCAGTILSSCNINTILPTIKPKTH